METKRYAPLNNHLEELRKLIVICFFVFAFFSVTSFWFSEKLVSIMLEPVSTLGYEIYFFAPHEAFLTRITMALLCGFFISIPVFFWQIWRFIVPGLKKKEKKVFLFGSFFVFILFVTGSVFSFYIVLPLSLSFLLSFQTEAIKPILSIKNYMSFCFSLLLAFGVMFQMPVAAMIFAWTGLVKKVFLTRHRKEVIVFIFIIAALLTPPDVVTQILLAIPLVFLYEVCIVIVGVIDKKK